MREYVDDKYMVLNDILLSYSGEEKDVIIPAEIGGLPIHTIGKGAFMFCDARGVVISEGIRKISEHAFSDCGELEEIFLFPSVKGIEDNSVSFNEKLGKVSQVLCYTDEEYEKLKKSCAFNGGTRYMAYEIPKIGDNAYLTPAVFGIDKVYRLPKGLRRLFVVQHYSHGFPVSFDHAFSKPFRPEEIFYPDGSVAVNDEVAALPYLFREGFPEPNPEVERQNERKEARTRKFGEHVPAFRSVVFLFNDRNTRHIGGKHYVIGEYSIGYHFWQSLVPRVEHGKLVYLYRRCFLGSELSLYRNNPEYVRYNIFFCDENGRNRWK